MNDGTAQAKKAIIQRYLAAYNAFDVETMLGFVHPEVVFKNISGGTVNAVAVGLPELRRLAEQSAHLFSSRRQEAIDFTFSGETVSADIAFEAVLAVDLPNGKRAGDRLRLNGRSVFAFRAGKLFRITDES